MRVSLDSSGNQGNADSTNPVISADGRFVAFASNASNLVPGDTNEETDVFVYDLRPGEGNEQGENKSAEGNGGAAAGAGAARAVDKSSSSSSVILAYLAGAGTILLIGSGVWYVKRRRAQ